MKSFKPIAILILFPAPLNTLVIPLFSHPSPPPSPTTGTPSQITSPSAPETSHQKRHALSPSRIIDTVIHREPPPDDPSQDLGDSLGIGMEALKELVSTERSDEAPDNSETGLPGKPPELDEMKFKKNSIRL
ncbi:hypothetical protein TWF718_003630 [Orbilia javanica]|uniref:Uncharacterized protein n=1 Tax=Orbilia javanica TaxID=47235 RepID=A0AAN8RKD3_9PEZI